MYLSKIWKRNFGIKKNTAPTFKFLNNIDIKPKTVYNNIYQN